MRYCVQWWNNIRENLRIQVITPVFVILFAGATGFIFASLNDFYVSAGTTITAGTTTVYTSSTNIDIPAYSINITAQAWGGGGGGGGGGVTARTGGGGGGAYVVKNFGKSQASGTMPMSIVVGGGGSGGASGNNNGQAGGPSSVTFNSVTATAGGGGLGQSGGKGGAGGTYSNGDSDSENGGDGRDGQVGSGRSPGGNAGGIAAGGGTGGTGSGSYAGPDNGKVPGGGGSGVSNSLFNTNAGGNGARGEVRVTYDTVSATINVTSITQNYGPHTGGNTVTITGSGFASGPNGGVNFTDICFGSVCTTDFTVNSDTSITLTVPESAVTGLVDVIFNYKDARDYFDWSTTKTGFYTYRPVTISSISANYGPHQGGNVVTITGSGFGGGASDANAIKPTSVCFGSDCTTNFTVVNDTTITVTVPSHVMINSLSDWVGVTINYNDPANQPSWSASKASLYEYRKGATTYKNECYSTDTGQWTSHPDYLYTAQGSTVNCRIILDGMYAGDIGLFDDYEERISPSLGGLFTATNGDPRFGFRNFALTYANTYDPNAQTLLYSYEAPDADVLDVFYDENANDGDGNGDDLFWPLLGITDSTEELIQLGDNVVLSLLAEKYYILPWQDGDIYCVNCSSTFKISTHGAPYFGTITMSDDISNIGHGGGQAGTFVGGNVIDLSTLEGADALFSYTPRTHTVTPGGYIRLSGTSANPSIDDSSFLDIEVIESGITVTGPTSLKRGETGEYTVEVLLGSTWPSGTVVMSDLFSGDGLASGTFVDVTAAKSAGPGGTFNPITRTYTFYDVGLVPGETYIRKFEYTVRNDAVTPPAFPSYVINMTGVTSTPATTGWASTNIVADRLMIKCTAGYPNCTTAYVGELQDYSIAPNGSMVGSATVSGNVGGGTLGNNGVANWTSSTPFVMSYTPASPGIKTLTATVTSNSTNSSMIGQSFASTNTDSLNSYIYVMANSMSLEGYENLSHGQTGYYILTMNGPFIGDINLSDALSGGASAGGTFDNGGVCTFSLADYNPTSNTSACAFEYTPATVSSDTIVTISASKTLGYNHTLPNTSMNVNVYPALTVTSVSPNQGKIDGGTEITITGKGFLPYMYGELVSCYRNPDAVGCAGVVLDVGGTPAACTNVKVINSTTITCTTSAHAAGYVSVKVDNGLENHTLNSAFNYVDIILNLSQTDVEIEVSPVSGSTFGTDTSTPSVSTNSQYGYTLTIEMATSEQRLYSIENDEYINPVSGTWSTPATLGTNTWGYAIDSMPIFSGNKFAAVPQGGATRQILKISNAAVTNDPTVVTFGTNISPLLPAGLYSGTVLYTAVVNEY